jgi:drug/metabolite transporter (DMT)-like permease
MLGEALALASAACFGLAGASIAQGMRLRTGPGGDNGALLSVIFSAMVAAALWLLLPSSAVVGTSGRVWAAAIALFVLAGLLSTVLGRLTFFRSVALSGATRSSLLRRMIPVFAALFAWIFLAEVPGLGDLAAMALILLGVLYAITGRATHTGPPAAPGVLVGLGLGLASAGFYGGSYVARKLGMVDVPDAAFGALVGALTGLACYAVASVVSRQARKVVLELPLTTDRWHVLTASALAAGQTTLFFALAHAEVAIVAVIGATEVFISALLASVVFRTEVRPSFRLVTGMTLAVAGVGVLMLS